MSGSVRGILRRRRRADGHGLASGGVSVGGAAGVVLGGGGGGVVLSGGAAVEEGSRDLLRGRGRVRRGVGGRVGASRVNGPIVVASGSDGAV